MQDFRTDKQASSGARRWIFIAIAFFVCIAAALAIYFMGLPPREKATQKAPPSASLSPLRPDTEKDSMDYKELIHRLGVVPEPKREYRIGVMVKFLGNPFWKKMADGMQDKARELGVAVDVRAALSENDPKGQLRLMEDMVGAEDPYDIFLISPQTGRNLIPAVERAEKKGIPVINVDGALLDNAKQWVGAPNYQKGVIAANYLLGKYTDGCKVAVIMGLRGVYDAHQRTNGFLDTLKKSGKPFPVVGTPHCDWDLQKALEATTKMLKEHPDLKAVYCNNDIMALGVVEAVSAHGKSVQVMVIGTDGIAEAYESIRKEELTATIDPSPDIAGAIAVEVAVRILNGQEVPRAVYAPQKLIDKTNWSD